MAADLIIYALVAAGLIFWLRTILGTRHGEERQRPNPISVKDIKEIETMLGQQNLAENAQADASREAIEKLYKNPTPVMSIADDKSQNGLIDIANKNKTFDVKQFLTAAQDVFVLVVESFAEGDRETLEDLLDKKVYKAFHKAIEDRKKADHTQKTQIHAISQSKIIEAKLDGNNANITVRFEADQTSVLEDEKGKTISGHPDRTERIIDIWTFSRNIKSKDPRWFVIETKGDFEDDNDIIPNA